MELKPIHSSGKSGLALPQVSDRLVEDNDDFQSTFDDWIHQCGTPLKDPTEDTFVDESGVLRYVENWQQVDNSTKNGMRSSLHSTGCVDVPVRLHEPQAGAQILNVNFLMDFRTLWDFLRRDSVDEIAGHAPLFRLYIELFVPRS